MASGWADGDYLKRPFDELLADAAGSDPAPAAGSVTAASLSLAAALTAKVARRSTRQLADAVRLAESADGLRARVEPLITGDAAAYAAVLAAKRGGGAGSGPGMGGSGSGTGADGGAVSKPESVNAEAAAMTEAVRIPVEIALTAADVVELAAQLAAHGNPNLRHDAIAAADLAAQCASVAASLAQANAADPSSPGAGVADAALSAAERASHSAAAIER